MKTKNTKRLFFSLVLFLVAACSISAMSSSLLFNASVNVTGEEDLKAGNTHSKIKTKGAESVAFKKAGPLNTGGRVRALLLDNKNPNVLYAGGVAGGLYKTKDGGENWEPVGGDVANVAVSCIAQDESGNIYVGTGEGFMNIKNENTMSNAKTTGRLGSGIFMKEASSETFKLLDKTKPDELEPTDKWSYINEIACNNGYLYAATNGGLMYSSNKGDSWQSSSIDTIVQDIKTIGDLVYFTQGDIEKGFVIKRANKDLSNEEEVFSNQSEINDGTNLDQNVRFGRIEMAVTSLDQNYLYASVSSTSGFGSGGSLLGIFVSTDKGLNWRRITTSGLSLHQNGNGNYSNSITVDPEDKGSVICGGSIIYVGRDINKEGTYKWDIKSSYNREYKEDPTNGVIYVPQNIHAIVFKSEKNKNSTYDYYVATDGGIYFYGERKDDAIGFQPYNYGLNISQFFSVAVSNDKSIAGGLHGNGTVYIAKPSKSLRADNTKFLPDFRGLIPTYHMGYGHSGGHVQASMFQRTNIDEVSKGFRRKAFFFTGPYSTAARAYGDYYNYTGSQAWGYEKAFLDTLWVTSNPLYTGNTVEDKYKRDFYTAQEVTTSLLWETTEDEKIKDSVSYKLISGIDIYDRYDDTDTIRDSSSRYTLEKGMTIRAGHMIFVRSMAHFDYPFIYTFPSDLTFVGDTIIRVKNPLQNRYFIAAKTSAKEFGIYMACYPTDFALAGSAGTGNKFPWKFIHSFDPARVDVPRCMAITKDGNTLFVGTNIFDASSGEVESSKLYRISGLLEFTGDEAVNPLKIEEITNYVGVRPISSISVDPRDGNNLLFTCENINRSYDNIYFIGNALAENVLDINVVARRGTIAGEELPKELPVYACLIDMKKDSKTAFIGTEKGLFMTEDIFVESPTWESVGGTDLGVPVYMIIQQTKNIPAANVTYKTEGGSQLYSFLGTEKSGAIYVATHGRGIFYCDDDRFINPSPNSIGIKSPKAERLAEKSLKIYPNPVKGIANIEYMLSKTDRVYVKIFGMDGKLFYQMDLGMKASGEYTHSVNCSSMRKGIYLVQILTGTEVMKSKMVVN